MKGQLVFSVRPCDKYKFKPSKCKDGETGLNNRKIMQCDPHLETRISIRPSLLLKVGAEISVKNIIYEVHNVILPSLFIANGRNMKG
jgi:hypothetical protein